ncbi:hypothetical protein EDB89DRAFT_2241995 [Lactarius sanguifluus]|nr:hypothetical protein EDB89DRAFT_2241995 [Lactarius sanguifluus]
MSRVSSPASQLDTTRDAGPPFHDIWPSLTVILRSSDNVDFFVLKPVLAKVSIVFKDMFELPDTAPEPPPVDVNSQARGVPLIELTEDSDTLYIVLRLCYPVENPDLSNIEDIRRFLEARRKYMIEAFDETIKDALFRAAESRPFSVFALASRYGLRDVANEAAKQMLSLPLTDLSDKSALKDITGPQYHRLLQYRRECIRRATTEPQLMWFNSLSSSFPPAPTTSSSCRAQFHFYFVSAHPRSLWVPHWWTSYLRRALLLLEDRPRGSTVTSTELMERFNEETVSCPDCQEEGKAALKKFSAALAQEVEKVIAQAGVSSYVRCRSPIDPVARRVPAKPKVERQAVITMIQRVQERFLGLHTIEIFLGTSKAEQAPVSKEIRIRTVGIMGIEPEFEYSRTPHIPYLSVDGPVYGL